MEIEKLLSHIRETDPKWGTEVAVCVCRWLEKAFPDAEICYLALPKEDGRERVRVLKQILKWEKNRGKDGQWQSGADTGVVQGKWGWIKENDLKLDL